MFKTLSVLEGCEYLRPSIVKERLESEFAYVATSEEAARQYFLELFGSDTAPCSRDDDDLDMRPFGDVCAGALYVQCGDDLRSEATLLGMFVIPDAPIIVDYSSPENERSTLPLIERCATVLGYRICCE